MNKRANAMTAAALLMSAAIGFAAQSSRPVGYTTVTVLANSDAVVSVPFAEEVEFTAAVDNISGIASGDLGLDVVLTAEAYADGGYYLRVTSGDAEGMWSTITDNGSNGVQVENSDILNNIAVDDTVAVFAHHTVGSVFTAEMLDVIYRDTTQVVVPNSATEGLNKFTAVYTYYPNGRPPINSTPGWYQSYTLKNDTVLDPESYILVRNNDDTDLIFAVSGLAITDIKKIIPAAAVDDDLYFSGLPVDMTVAELGLEGFGQLAVIDNTQADQFNKFLAVYTYYPSGRPPINSTPGWYQSYTLKNDEVIAAGTGFVLRRPAGASESTWALSK